jgi:hypothetical protein
LKKGKLDRSEYSSAFLRLGCNAISSYEVFGVALFCFLPKLLTLLRIHTGKLVAVVEVFHPDMRLSERAMVLVLDRGKALNERLEVDRRRGSWDSVAARGQL